MLSVLEIGEKITIARKMKNLSQAQLAKLLAISAQAVGKWERGESMPDIIMFGRLAASLGFDLNYFAYERDTPSLLTNTLQLDKPENATRRKTGWNMSSSNWVALNFSGLSGLAHKLSWANIDNCQFINSELSGLALRGNNIQHSDFSCSDLNECKFTDSSFKNSVFKACDFSKSIFSRSSITNCDFSGADLTDVVLKWSHFKKVKLSEVILNRTTFQLGQLTEITFDGEITNCSFENCDFACVEFYGANIRNTFFKNSKLQRAKFTACKTDRISYAFMKACKADLSSVEFIE